MRNAALTLSRPRPRAGRGLILVRDFIVDYTVLVFAYLVAIYLRQELPFGRYVGANYQWQEPGIYILSGLSLAVAYTLVLGVGRQWSPARHCFAVGAAILLTAAGLTAFVPRQSALEKGYFV